MKIVQVKIYIILNFAYISSFVWLKTSMINNRRIV